MAVVQYTYTHKQYRERHKTNNIQINTKIHRTAQKIHRKTKIRKSAGRAPSLRVLPWHLPYNWGKGTEKNQKPHNLFPNCLKNFPPFAELRDSFSFLIHICPPLVPCMSHFRPHTIIYSVRFFPTKFSTHFQPLPSVSFSPYDPSIRCTHSNYVGSGCEDGVVSKLLQFTLSWVRILFPILCSWNVLNLCPPLSVKLLKWFQQRQWQMWGPLKLPKLCPMSSRFICTDKFMWT